MEEVWLAEEKQRTLQKVPEYFITKKASVAEDGGDKSVSAPLAGGSLKSNRKLVENDCCCLKSKKPKISKGKIKVDDRDSKGVTKTQKVSVKRTDPRFKRPLNWSLFETAADLEGSKVDAWDTREDMVLMSAWIFVSEDATRGKNQKKGKLWSRVKEHYDATRTENPEELGVRNENQMKGRWYRLNENASKWVGAYTEAYRQKKSGMSSTDVENVAHKIYEVSGKKFNDLKVFNEVMCKHPKWDLQLHRETTRSRSVCEVDDEESGGSTKRSRTLEEGDSVDINQESPISGSTIQRQRCNQKKGKGKASQFFSISNDFNKNLRALIITRNNELEMMKKKINFDQENFQIVQDHKMLRVLMSKESPSPAQEELKECLLAKLYG